MTFVYIIAALLLGWGLWWWFIGRNVPEDWVVFARDGGIHGGYTQRVMFKRAREQYGSLPPELEKQEARYVD